MTTTPRNGDADADGTERRLPPLAQGDALTLLGLDPEGHATQPPPRYTEATLVKALEERGIGRPSTYASIMGTILDRGYVWKRGGALVPSFLAFAVVTLLEKHFGDLVDYDFTARMEEGLDAIAGRRGAAPGHPAPLLLRRRRCRSHGTVAGATGPDGRRLPRAAPDGRRPRRDRRARDQLDPGRRRHRAARRPVRPVPRARVDRAGRRPSRPSAPTSPRTSRPTSSPPRRPRSCSRARPATASSAPTRRTGRPIVAKAGRFGPYVTEVLPDDAPEDAPSRAPRRCSRHGARHDHPRRRAAPAHAAARGRRRPADGGEITAQNGRYGPYLKKGTDSRSLGGEEQLFTVALDEALAIFAQPKPRGRGRAAAPPLRELGADPVSGKPIVVKEGRFGAVRHRRRDQRDAAQGRRRRDA